MDSTKATQQSNRTTTLRDPRDWLPTELVLHIFGFLDSDSLRAATRVSQAWRHFLWQPLNIEEVEEVEPLLLRRVALLEGHTRIVMRMLQWGELLVTCGGSRGLFYAEKEEQRGIPREDAIVRVWSRSDLSANVEDEEEGEERNAGPKERSRRKGNRTTEHKKTKKKALKIKLEGLMEHEKRVTALAVWNDQLWCGSNDCSIHLWSKIRSTKREGKSGWSFSRTRVIERAHSETVRALCPWNVGNGDEEDAEEGGDEEENKQKEKEEEHDKMKERAKLKEIMASGAEDQKVRLWDERGSPAMMSNNGSALVHGEGVGCMVVWNGDLFCGCRDGVIAQWSVNVGDDKQQQPRCVDKWQAHSYLCVVLLVWRKHLWSCGRSDGLLKCWEAEDEREGGEERKKKHSCILSVDIKEKGGQTGSTVAACVWKDLLWMLTQNSLGVWDGDGHCLACYPSLHFALTTAICTTKKDEKKKKEAKELVLQSDEDEVCSSLAIWGDDCLAIGGSNARILVLQQEKQERNSNEKKAKEHPKKEERSKMTSSTKDGNDGNENDDESKKCVCQ
ncbi:hypothetical protein QOT17_023355 [Balamuthia mandrillaris]